MQHLGRTPRSNLEKKKKNIYYSHVTGHHYLIYASVMFGFGSQQNSQWGREVSEKGSRESKNELEPETHYATVHCLSTLTR